MKSFFIKLSTLVISACIVTFIAKYIYKKTNNSYKSCIVTISKIETKAPANGVIYKDETILNFNENAIIKNMQTDGTKIGVDSEIVQIYTTKEDALKYEKISALKDELENLEKVQNEINSHGLDFLNLDKQIFSSYDKILQYIKLRQINNIEETKKNLTLFLNTRQAMINKKIDFKNSISKISNEIKKLEKTINMPKTIVTKESGFFVGSTDGLEEKCSLKNIDNLNIDEFGKFLNSFDSKKQTNKKNVKIITSPEIFFKATVPTKQLINKKINSICKIYLKETKEKVCATLKNIILNFKGNLSLAIFEIHDMTEKLARLRKSEADIIFKKIECFKIPKNAVKTNDKNETGVFVIDGISMKFKKISILFENEDFVFCSINPKDRSENENYLKNLDRIITKGRDLYDNKRI